MTEKATKRRSLSLDELIDALVQIRLQSPLKGSTMPHICIQGYEYQAIHEVKLAETDAGDENNPSGVVLLFSDSLDNIIDELSMDAALGEDAVDMLGMQVIDTDEIDEAPELEE